MSCSAQLNNLGVTALEDSNYEEASEYLHQAVDARRSFPSDESENSSSRRRSDSSTSFSTNMPRMERGDHRVHAGATIPVLSSIEERNYQQDLFPASAATSSSCSDAFVYRKGFMIYPSEAEFPGLNSEQSCQHAYYIEASAVAIESAFLLFNLGLVYHLRGEQIGDDNQQQVLKAVRLYEMALGLVQKMLQSSSGCHLINSRLPCLMVAILNNLAGILYEQGNYQLSKKFFRGLSEVLIFMSISGVDQGVEQGDWAGLILNVMVFSDPKLAPAA